jgi:hypothetical protein
LLASVFKALDSIRPARHLQCRTNTYIIRKYMTAKIHWIAALALLLAGGCGTDDFGDSEPSAHDEPSDFIVSSGVSGKSDELSANFNKNTIVSDSFFEDADAVDGDDIQAFLEDTPWAVLDGRRKGRRSEGGRPDGVSGTRRKHQPRHAFDSPAGRARLGQQDVKTIAGESKPCTGMRLL